MENSNKSLIPVDKKGSGIHIKKKNRGLFTEYCGGEVTLKCIDKAKKSKNPTLRKRATFADNARKWKHALGGFITKHQDGTTQGGILKRFGKAVYGLFLPEYEGTFQEAYRQARINGDNKFKWDGNHYTTELKPDETLEALKQWDTKGDLGKEEFKNLAIRNPNAFRDFYSKSYPTHLKNHNFDALYGAALYYDRNVERKTNNNLGSIVYKNLEDGWDQDMIAAAMGNSYVETAGWNKLTQTDGPAKGLFMMEAPERARYRKWLNDNKLKASQANEVNYIQHLFDSKSKSLGTPWSNLDNPVVLDRVNQTRKLKKLSLLNTGDEVRDLVKTFKSKAEADKYGLGSAWQHQDYTSELAWNDWETGDLDAKTKAFEALFERAGKPHMDRRYYLSHLIKKNQHLFTK